MNRYHGSTMFCKECVAESDIFVDPRAGEIVCRTCAVVLGERCIDDGAEWRTFTTDDVSNKPDPSRCGDVSSPLLSTASGMNTMIEGGNDKKQTARLQKAQGIAMRESASEVALKMDFYGKVRELAHRLGLTHAMQEDACLLLRKAEENGLFKTKKAERGEAMCVAVTYITCRVWRRGQTMKEMAAIANVSLSALNKAFKKLCNNMEFDKGTVRAEHLIPPLCDKLGVPAFVTVAAKYAAQQASRWDLVGGMGPAAVAASAVLLVCSCWKPAACREVKGKGRKRSSPPPPKKQKLEQKKEKEEEEEEEEQQQQRKGDNKKEERGRGVDKEATVAPASVVRAAWKGGAGGGKEEEEEEDGEELRLGPTAVAASQEISTNAMKRPYRAMFEQRGRLVTADFLERRAAKGFALEGLQPALV